MIEGQGRPQPESESPSTGEPFSKGRGSRCLCSSRDRESAFPLPSGFQRKPARRGEGHLLYSVCWFQATLFWRRPHRHVGNHVFLSPCASLTGSGPYTKPTVTGCAEDCRCRPLPRPPLPANTSHPVVFPLVLPSMTLNRMP